MAESKWAIPFRDSAIRNLQPPPSGKDREEWRFPERNGLTVRVYANGRKAFYVGFRFGKSQERVRLLPDYPALGCTSATKQWQRILADVVLGINPAQVRRDRRLESEPKAQPKTLSTVWGEYLREKSDGWSDNHRTSVSHAFNAYILPKLGKYSLAAITRDDIRELIQEILDRGKGRTANVVHTSLTTFFNWAVDEPQYLTASPVQRLKRRHKDEPRDRTLTDQELVAIIGGARRLPYPHGSYVLALLGSAQRRSEVSKMRSSNIDNGVWTIIRPDSKNRRAHRVPLPPFVLAVLEDARREIDANIRRHCEETNRPVPEVAPGFDYIFGSRYRGRITSFSAVKAKLDAEIEAFCAETGLPVPAGWKLHDLRRSAGSVLARLGIPSATIGRVMNHAEKGVTAKVYIQHSYEREIGDALKAWSDHLVRLERGGQLVLRAV
jgi:integrase